MITIRHETLLTLSDAARRLPSRQRGKRVHLATVFRWIRQGIGGVRLEAVRIGGAWYTSEEALQRFGDALTLGKQAASRVTVQRTRQAESAEFELDAAGF